MTAELFLDARAELGEGPVWDEETRRLLWVDILAGALHVTDPETGEDSVVEIGQELGAAAPRVGGGAVLAIRDGFALLDPDGAIRTVAEVEADNPASRMNDGACDRAGRFWAGTMAFAETPGAGALYRLDADLTVTRMLDGLTVSNGVGWSPDDRTFYFADTPTGSVDAFDFDLGTGEIENRRRFASIDPGVGAPDGLTVDAEGFVWVALWGGSRVQRYAPDGRLDRELALPASQVTKPAFGGPTLSDLYVTTAWHGLDEAERARQPAAGGVFRLRPGAVGRPANRFAA